MTYREEITEAMQALAKDERTFFVGYGLRYGRAMGTLAGIPDEQIIETPVAENLMVGLAHGMALNGFRPVVFFERFDFVLNAADAIINHLACAKAISRGEFSPGVIIRVVVGNSRKPLFTGATHTQEFSQAFDLMSKHLAVLCCYGAAGVGIQYAGAIERQANGESTMVVEYKDLL